MFNFEKLGNNKINFYIQIALILSFSFYFSSYYKDLIFNFNFNLIFIFLFLIFFSRFIYIFITLPFVMIISISSIIYKSYGDMNEGILISIFETNSLEFFDFLKSLSLEDCVLFLSVLIFLIFSIFFTKQVVNIKNIIFFGFSIVSLFFIFPDDIDYHERSALNTINDFEQSIHGTFFLMKKNNQYHYDYPVVADKMKYKYYVVVIGESASKNYMSLYGYPVKTTPFLDQVNKRYIKNYVSSAGYTALSIPRTLSSNDNDIISLSNKLNIRTYWLSNQNVSGFHDSPNTKIALNSVYVNFINKGKKDDDTNNDNMLIPLFENIIQEQDESTKLVVLHLRGSHYNFHERLAKDSFKFNFDDKELSNYLSTIKQTDELLKNIHTLLVDTGKDFSLVYFSDHGLNNTTLKHGQNFKDNFDVPFVEISSDMKDSKEINIYQSAYNFLDFFEEWLMVKTERPKKISKFYHGEQIDQLQIYADGLQKYGHLPSSRLRIP